jgi:hypothetical protein
MATGRRLGREGGGQQHHNCGVRSVVRACVCLAPTRRRGVLPGPGRYRPMQICRLIELETQKGLRAKPRPGRFEPRGLFLRFSGHAGGFLRLARQIPGWPEQPADLRSHRPPEMQRRSSGAWSREVYHGLLCRQTTHATTTRAGLEGFLTETGSLRWQRRYLGSRTWHLYDQFTFVIFAKTTTNEVCPKPPALPAPTSTFSFLFSLSLFCSSDVPRPDFPIIGRLKAQPSPLVVSWHPPYPPQSPSSTVLVTARH